MHPLPLAQIIQTVLAEFPTTQGIYLYGSFATGEENENSDVDLAILLPHVAAKEVGPLYFSNLYTRLSRLLQRDIDLINLRLAPTILGNQIVSNGMLIFGADQAACDDFAALNLSYYQKLNQERAGILADFFRTKRAYAVWATSSSARSPLSSAASSGPENALPKIFYPTQSAKTLPSST